MSCIVDYLSISVLALQRGKGLEQVSKSMLPVNEIGIIMINVWLAQAADYDTHTGISRPGCPRSASSGDGTGHPPRYFP